jgi:hypothetical protein
MYIDDKTKFIQICIYKKNELYNNVMNKKKERKKEHCCKRTDFREIKNKKRKEKCLQIFIKYKLQYIYVDLFTES